MNLTPVSPGTAASSCSGRRRQSLRLAVAFALVAGGAAVAPASASLVGGMAAGYNITTIHNIDMVVVSAPAVTPDGVNAKVEIKRDGAVVATAVGPIVMTREGPAMEVNHGPEGTPGPGDCWDTAKTNDIVQVGDHVVFSVDGVRKGEVIVDDLRLTDIARERGNEIYVPFTLDKADGSTPTGVEGEYRGPSDNQFRAAPAVRKLTDTTYELVYSAPLYGVERNRNGLDPRTELLSGDGHAAMFGHIDGAPEMQMVEGRANSSGPAPGCPAPGSGGGGGGGGVDNQAPSVPASLTATVVSTTEIKLDWAASSDNVGVAGYRISRAGAADVDVVGATTRTVSGLEPGTRYTFTVRAYDAAGNESGASQAAATTKSTTPTATAPDAPGIRRASSGTAGGSISATARWTAPTSNGGSAITGYFVRAERFSSASSNTALEEKVSTLRSPSARSYKFTVGKKGTWRFSVRAVNAVGNSAYSDRSNAVTAR